MQLRQCNLASVARKILGSRDGWSDARPAIDSKTGIRAIPKLLKT
jgi:hypothetical protein